MAQTEIGRQMSLSLFAKNWAECKEQSDVRSALSSALVSALRSLSSVALSSARVPTVYQPIYQPLAKGTFLLCQTGDISTLG